MCQTSQFITLTETKNSQITWCKGCNTFSISYKCCCASFTEKELKHFNQLLRGLRPVDHNYEFMGRPHAIIKNARTQVGFCLTQKDSTKLGELTSEALEIFQAFKVIYQS